MMHRALVLPLWIAAVTCATLPVAPTRQLLFTVYPPDATIHVTATDPAAESIWAAAEWMRQTRREFAGCVPHYYIVGDGGERFVVLQSVTRPSGWWSDSLNVWWTHDPCAVQGVGAHGHVAANGIFGVPSGTDEGTQVRRKSPFDMLVSALPDGSVVVTLYGLAHP